MPTFGSGYTIEDFLRRLNACPVAHISGHYHENRSLFIHRDDFFCKAVTTLSWERGLALLSAARHTQPVSVDVYRSMLARMVLHNRYVMRTRQAAVQPGTRVSGLVSWRAAIGVYSEAMRTHGLRCPTQLSLSVLRLLGPHHAYAAALSVLQLEQANRRLTKPMLLNAARVCACSTAWETALQLLDHVHQQDSDWLSDAISALRLNGTDAFAVAHARHSLLPPSTPMISSRQRHIAAVLAEVIGALPWATALRLPLCQSYWTHLAASTTLQPAEKAAHLLLSTNRLPWQHVRQLLAEYTEPQLALPEGDTDATPEEASSLVPAEVLPPALVLQLEEAPDTLAVLLAAVSAKLPSAQEAHRFLRHLQRVARRREGSGLHQALGHPVVWESLLRQCAASEGGWRTAVPLLSRESFRPSPSAVLSRLVKQLREEREPVAAVQLLVQHIIPTQSRLEPAAMTMLLECVLAHNQSLAESSAQPPPPSPLAPTGRVDWLTALSVLLKQQVHTTENRVLKTGTGPSRGAVPLPLPPLPSEVATPLTHAQLRLAVLLCVEAGSCLGAILMQGYARRVNRTEVPHSREITALLYGLHYNRPAEVNLLLRVAEEKYGRESVMPLHHLVSLYRPWQDKEKPC